MNILLCTYVEHKEHLDSFLGCRPCVRRRSHQWRISVSVCIFEHIPSDIHSASMRDPSHSFVWAFVIAPWQERMSFRTPRTLQGCRIQIYIAQHFQSIPFVIDEAFSDIQTHKTYLLLPPAQCWRQWRDKHHYGLLNNRRFDIENGQEKKGFDFYWCGHFNVDEWLKEKKSLNITLHFGNIHVKEWNPLSFFCLLFQSSMRLR